MPVPTLRRALGAVGLAVATAVVSTAAAPSATAAEVRGTAVAVPVHEVPAVAADFRHWGGAYADKASAEAAGALLQLSGSAIAFVVELVNSGRAREYVLWYW